MSNPANHPLIGFASKYNDASQNYLNAYMAIARLESLLEDAELTSNLLDAANPADQRWHPWFGAEIISYYSVGYVTCLEWHAKSRLIDMLEFMPSALTVEDVKGTITDKLIVQMVAAQASVAQLVGASIRVTSKDRYFGLVDRVFRALKMPFSVFDWLTGKASESNVCWIRPDQLQLLDELFEFRHELAHEIGVNTMGHPNIRSSWPPDVALSMGRFCTSIIYGIEAAFTNFAPALFPNLLTEERYPVSPHENLKAEMSRLSEIIDKEVKTSDWMGTHTLKAWSKACSAFDKYLEAEDQFIDNAAMLHWRYMDAKTPLRVRLLSYRIGFLNELLGHLSIEADDNPNAVDNAPIEDDAQSESSGC